MTAMGSYLLGHLELGHKFLIVFFIKSFILLNHFPMILNHMNLLKLLRLISLLGLPYHPHVHLIKLILLFQKLRIIHEETAFKRLLFLEFVEFDAEIGVEFVD